MERVERSMELHILGESYPAVTWTATGPVVVPLGEGYSIVRFFKFDFPLAEWGQAYAVLTDSKKNGTTYLHFRLRTFDFLPAASGKVK